MNDDINDEELARSLREIEQRLPLERDEPVRAASSIGALRARRGMPSPSGRATLSLERVDGLLRWNYRRPPSKVGPRRARRGAVSFAGSNTVHEFRFQEVPPNLIIQKLVEFDGKLTPNQGLRRWTGSGAAAELEAIAAPDSTPRTLLFVHGTFSKSDVFFSELRSAPGWAELLATLKARYGQILAFDHPTLSVSPMLNALDLNHALGDYAGEFDVVCHSRGGLVVAWWLRLAKRNVRRVIFVGSPLEGTSLAAPARIKATLDYLSNFADTLSKVATVGSYVPPLAPVMTVVAGLMSIVGGVLTVGARTPIIDAGVAIVPGLMAQSKVANNQELLRLHQHAWPSTPTAYAVVSNFEPVDPDEPRWKFWKRWANPLGSAADVLADRLFDGPNDLVVDNNTMTRIVTAPFQAANVLTFDVKERVHHCNYFAQPKTVEAIGQWLAK
jgi:pimeloyl-ACP methyl ester carboxylesterase